MTAITPEIQAKLDVRERARTDKFYLATEILGMDFQKNVHQELFDTFVPFNNKKAWRDQSPVHDRLVLWARGHFKSSAIVVEIIQAVLNFPDIRILIMQGSIGVTQNLLHEVKSHFLGIAPRSRFREIFPDFCADALGTINKFTTPARTQMQLQQATVTVASPNSIKTGQHYDALFGDDLVNESNFQSARKLEKAEKQFKAMIPLIDPGGYRYVTGTRYAFGDLYENIIRFNTNGQWAVTLKDCWSDDRIEVRFPQKTLADGRIIGFTREQLLQIQREDPAMFSAQYLNKPATGTTQLFTNEKMLAVVIAGDEAPLLSSAVLFVDLAGASNGVQNDDSVVLAGKTDHLANMYVVDGVGGQWTPAQLAIQLIEMALKHRPLKVMLEKTANTAYFVEYLRIVCRDKNIILPIDFIPVNNTKDAKLIRISSLEGHVRAKRLKFFAGLPCWEKMFQQFVEFPKARYGHDDYPDTVALMAQTFGSSYRPVTPLSAQRHPLLAAMDLQEMQQQAAGIFTQDGQLVKYSNDSMGDEFS